MWLEAWPARAVSQPSRLPVHTQSSVWATGTKSKRAGRLAGSATVQLKFDGARLPDGTAFPMRATVIRVGLAPVLLHLVRATSI
jgi:hypothetical protein